jgi:HEAT repeat protein/cyclophilin family peptidyl-prolyl cis-trans isomerase
MPSAQPAMLGIGCLCALLLGCATSAVRHGPDSGADVSSSLLERRARILSAEDRREVDDDLLASLQHGDPGIRALAVQALGRIGAASESERIAAALEDPDPGVRQKAAFALGLLGARGADVVPPLALLADPDPSVRAAVADALGLVADDDTSDRLLTLLGDRDGQVVARACYSAPGFEQPGFAVERLIELSAHADPTVAFACTWALSDLSADADRLDLRTRERARRRMLEAARSPHSWIRRLGAVGLFIPTREEEAATVGRLVDDPEPAVRIAAVGAISFPGAPLDPFISKALEDTDDRVYLAVIRGLGRMRGDEIAETLARIVVHGEREWAREQAVISLGRASNVSARMANGLSRDKDVTIRRSTAGVLLGRIDDDTVEYARRLYADPDASVRAEVIPAFAEIDEPLSATLSGAIDSEDPAIQAAVARAVSRRLALAETDGQSDEDTLSVLRRVWARARDASDLTTALEVLSATSHLDPHDTAREILEEALAFPDWYVRRLAAAQLEPVRGVEAREAALPAVDLPLDHYLEIARWASRPRAAIVTVQRPGFVPGRFTVRLDVEATPLTAWRFARLSAEGRYDDRPIETVAPDIAAYVAGPRSGGPDGPGGTLRDEIRSTPFSPGTLGLTSPGPDGSDGAWFVTLTSRPEMMRRATAFGQVIQNFPGVVARLLPGDRVVSVEVYEGDGTEPLPPLEP